MYVYVYLHAYAAISTDVFLFLVMYVPWDSRPSSATVSRSTRTAAFFPEHPRLCGSRSYPSSTGFRLTEFWGLLNDKMNITSGLGTKTLQGLKVTNVYPCGFFLSQHGQKRQIVRIPWSIC